MLRSLLVAALLVCAAAQNGQVQQARHLQGGVPLARPGAASGDAVQAVTPMPRAPPRLADFYSSAAYPWPPAVRPDPAGEAAPAAGAPRCPRPAAGAVVPRHPVSFLGGVFAAGGRGCPLRRGPAASPDRSGDGPGAEGPLRRGADQGQQPRLAVGRAAGRRAGGCRAVAAADAGGDSAAAGAQQRGGWQLSAGCALFENEF